MTNRDDARQETDASGTPDQGGKRHPHRGRAGADAVLLAALAGGATHQEAADAARVSLATVTRRLREPAFRQRLADARRRHLDRTLDILTAAAAQAARTLAELCGPGVPKLADDSLEPTPASARIAAAKALLEVGSKLRQEIDIDDRLRRVEETISQTAQVCYLRN